MTEGATMYDEYEELVRLLKDKAARFDYDGWVDTAVVMEKAADTIEKLVEVIQNHDFLESLIEPRWIPATKAPALKVGDEGYPGYLVYANGYYEVADYAVDRLGNGPSFHVDGEYEPYITHYMPLPDPPKEEL